MDDELLVTRAIAGDLDSFGQLYDRHFARIYDFAWRMLRDADAAGEATRAIFLSAAQTLRSGSKASSFEAWLFGFAYTRLVGQASTRTETAGPSHEEGFGAFDAPDPSRVDDPSITAADPELPSEVWEAASSLSPRDYGLLDLHLRQKIEASELAHIMGLSRANAPLMLERLEAAASDVMTTYLLARRGPQGCEELRRIVSGEQFPPLTAELRSRIDAHAAGCQTCRPIRSLPAPPLVVFAALAPITAPFILKGEVWRSLVGMWPQDPQAAMLASEQLPPAPEPSTSDAPLYAAAAALPLGAAGAGGRGGEGGGIQGFFGDESRRNMLLFAGAAAGMLLVAFITGALILKAFGGGGGGAGVPATATRAPGTATPQTTLTAGVNIETATPRASETAGPTDTPVPPPPDTPTPPPPPPTPTHTPPRAATPTPPRGTPTRTPTRRPGG